VIRAQALRRRGRIVALTVRGHADSAPYGEDLVCAGVSALVQTAMLALARLDKEAPAATISEGDVRWAGESGDAGQTILETCLIGLEDISRTHPGALRVQVKEAEA